MSDKNGRQIQLYGRVVLLGEIKAVTGLHIGTSKETMEIGGVDMPIVRNPVNRQPYIPGSSLKGKMRSLWEKLSGVTSNFQIGKSNDVAKQVWIHMCEDSECKVCSLYGTTGDSAKKAPARLMVRDVPLDAVSLPETVVDFTEVKWEAAIDRVTSAATPRQMERVPAGAIFSPMELVFSFYGKEDVARFGDVLTALQLVEDDYLGGQGSRGSGKVEFKQLRLALKSSAKGYDQPLWRPDEEKYTNLASLLEDKTNILGWLRDNLKF